jgi:hypothetical protein
MKETIEEGILDDVLNLGSRFLYYWKKKWILNTKHGIERIIQRSRLSIQELKFLFKNAIEKFTKLKAKAGAEFLFYSKSLKQGFISVVERDGNLKLITFLPRGKSFPKPGTKKMVIEGVEYENITYVELD